MIIDTDALVSAGSIPADDGEIYIVVWTDGSHTLKSGDEVVMRETQDKKHAFVRIQDHSIHSIFGTKGGAFMVVQKKERQ